MNVVVEEWINKAEGDYRTATREFRADPANYDAVCFHTQQCIEKLLKAILILHQTGAPKAHDLIVLSNLVAQVVPSWEWKAEELRLLTRAAVAFRYPGEQAGEEEASAALEICTSMRAKLLLICQAE